MSMEYIRTYYRVPAKRGQSVTVEGKRGVITGSRDAYVRIRLYGEKKTKLYHPLHDGLEYEEAQHE